MSIKTYCVILLILATLQNTGCTSNKGSTEVTHTLGGEEIDTLIFFAGQKLEKMLAWLENKQELPRSYSQGQLVTTNRSDWTVGFFPGMLWYMYEYSGDDKWKRQAEKWTDLLEVNKSLDWNTHDLGFMMFNSYGKGYHITGQPGYKATLLQTADSLAALFNPKVGTTLSWPWKKHWSHNTIIDNMMNLELLTWAATHGGDPIYKDMALEHALKTKENHVRSDFSSFHVVDYDKETGAVRASVTAQGFADESTWSRGQAWGIYGFTMMYRETGNLGCLEVAEGMANFFLDHLPEDLVPYWDFNAPSIPNEPRDASAACIAASALVELAGLTGNVYYLQAANNILSSLAQNYLYPIREENPFMIKHCTGAKPANSEVDVPLIYADYYFLEALLRLKHLEEPRFVSLGINKRS